MNNYRKIVTAISGLLIAFSFNKVFQLQFSMFNILNIMLFVLIILVFAYHAKNSESNDVMFHIETGILFLSGLNIQIKLKFFLFLSVYFALKLVDLYIKKRIKTNSIFKNLIPINFVLSSIPLALISIKKYNLTIHIMCATFLIIGAAFLLKSEQSDVHTE